MNSEIKVSTKFLYTKDFQCLFDKTKFTIYKLYPSAKERFERTDEFFDMVFYEKPAGAKEFCNYLFLEVKVCPGCLFSSSDDGHFKSTIPGIEVFEVSANEKEKILEDKVKRLEIAKSAKNMFTQERTFEDAIISFRLGISSSETLYKANQRRNAVELARMGTYSLKMARLFDENNMKEEKESALLNALENFKGAISADIKGAMYYKSLYQASALAIYFGDNAIVSHSYEILRKLKEKEGSKVLNTYLARLHRLWEDRDFYKKKD